MINVRQLDNSNFEVTVKQEKTTKHLVAFTDDYFEEFKKHNAKITVIEDSFKFLLERENNVSILSKFNLRIIENFFPDYKNLKSKV